MLGLTEIKKVQDQGAWANHEVRTAEELLLDVIQFLCCNKFMRVLRFLFRKRFDEQYDKLSKAHTWLNAAIESLNDQWVLLEDYWDQVATEDLRDEYENEME